MEAIRKDPDKFIKLMSPVVADAMKVVAEEYGGAFHDTGRSPRGEPLPAGGHSQFGPAVTIEPGNGAPDLRTLKLFFGHWSTEGVNAVDYFQNLGEITWAADMKAWFEAHGPLCICSASTTAARLRGRAARCVAPTGRLPLEPVAE